MRVHSHYRVSAMLVALDSATQDRRDHLPDPGSIAKYADAFSGILERAGCR